jgi:predicted phosphodiesterase
MKLGLVADIHGNSFALRQVLGELRESGCDRIVCLGDIAVLGPDPAGSIALVREHCSETVLGNVDRWLVNRLDDEELHQTRSDELRQLAGWSLDHLRPDDLAWLDSLPASQSLELREQSLLVYHGSPRSNDEIISPTTPPGALSEMFPDPMPDIAVGGHTHIPMLRRVDRLMLANPGSVGLPGVGPGTPDLPLNRDVAWAEYAVLDIDVLATTFAFHRIELDLVAMFNWAESTGMPAFDWWKSKWRSV